MTTIKTIAACDRQTCATGRFSVNPYAGMGKLKNRLKSAVTLPAHEHHPKAGVTEETQGTAPIHAGLRVTPARFDGVTGVTSWASTAHGKLSPKRCDSIHAGAIHTIKQASKLYVKELFSRPEFIGTGFSVSHGFGAGSAYPQGRQHNLFCVDIPSSTLWPIQSYGGFQFNKERETMTKVTTPSMPKTGNPAPLARQHAIEAALSLALHHARNGELHAATGRAIRAASMLKQACAELKQGGAA